MSDDIAIRPGETAELSVCAQFWIAMYEEIGLYREEQFAPDWRRHWTEYFAGRMAEGEARFFVAAIDGRIIATAGALVQDGYPSVVHGLRFGYVFGVRVQPEYRGRGIATQLTRCCINFLQERRCVRIRLHASREGRTIYEKLGFDATNEMQLRSVPG